MAKSKILIASTRVSKGDTLEKIARAVTWFAWVSKKRTKVEGKIDFIPGIRMSPKSISKPPTDAEILISNRLGKYFRRIDGVYYIQDKDQNRWHQVQDIPKEFRKRKRQSPKK